MRLLPVVLVSALLTGCAGSNSTLKNGFAYRMNRETAAATVQGALAANVPNDRIKSTTDLTASGSIRYMLDKHTFYASAIPLPAQQAYGFEVSHSGTLFNGPATAHRIYRSLLERADRSGQRIAVTPSH